MNNSLEKLLKKSSPAPKTANICIIGAGRVGTTIAAALIKAAEPTINLSAISSPSQKSRKRLEEIISGIMVEDASKDIFITTDNVKCFLKGNVIFICTPDDIINKVCRQLAPHTDPGQRKLFMHFSGAKTLKVLYPVKKAGGFTASVHPLKSFASIEDSIKTLDGTIYGTTFSKELTEEHRIFIKKLISILKGSMIEVDDEKKSIYHASACIASNYLVSLINYAVKTNEKIGISPEDTLKGLIGLIEGTVANIKNIGTKKSLTGPVARGDTGTIKQHIESFKKYFKPQDYKVYMTMGTETALLAYENGWIDTKTLEKFKKLFSHTG